MLQLSVGSFLLISVLIDPSDKPSSVILIFFFSSRRRHTRCLSDWSSDVCSSDLPEVSHLALERLLLLAAGLGRQDQPLLLHLLAELVDLHLSVVDVLLHRRLVLLEIGRASCRERGWHPVGAVSCQRKTKQSAERR